MIDKKHKWSGAGLCIGLGLVIGLSLLGYQLSKAIVAFKEMNREVVVKGLAEKEVYANVAIWPLQFSIGENNIKVLTDEVKKKDTGIVNFLKQEGFLDTEISISPLSITDNAAQAYYNNNKLRFRYSATSTVTLYTHQVKKVLEAMQSISKLGEEGIAISTNGYNTSPKFLVTKLNEIKPGMLDQAINNARASAEKFAKQSHSHLGRIRSASQGVFSVQDRDKNTPYIKKVRVVSTLSYYLVN